MAPKRSPARAQGVKPGAPNLSRSTYYINRELSWLSFARRVLAMAEDRSLPLLERVKSKFRRVRLN